MGELAALAQGLKDLAWKAYELEETVKNFGEESQPIFEERMQRFVEGVRQLVPFTHAVEGVTIPAELLQYMDKGGNPHQYTAEVFQASIRDNQVSKGKVDAVQMLFDELLTRYQGAYPQEAQQYLELVTQQQQQQGAGGDMS